MSELLNKVAEMIFKEENILYPMLKEKLTQEEWGTVAEECKEYGYLIDDVPEWTNDNKIMQEERETTSSENGEIVLPTGKFKLEELKCVLNTLPFDLTFVDKDDHVKYFSGGKERIFASVHVVQGIVEDFKNNKKDSEEFWIHMGDKLVMIRYFAVRDEAGEYLGVLEVTQDIKRIQGLQGEKRLVADE